MCGEISDSMIKETGKSNNEPNYESNCDIKQTLALSTRIEASVALQVLPWVAMDEVYGIVDSIIEYIKKSGVNYVVGPFETTMEGDLDVLLDIVKQTQHIAIEMGAPEVISMVKIAYRPDEIGSASMESKTRKFQ